MIVTIHQPEHLPWLGFCNKADQADVLVLLDIVQYRTNYFQNRNRILGSGGIPQWLTVPVLTKGHTNLTIKDMRINNTINWREKCWKSIFFSYSKHPYFAEYGSFFEQLYRKEWEYLSQLNESIILNLFSMLGVQTRIVRASNLGIQGRSSFLLRDICLRMGTTAYLAGQSAKEYLDEKIFTEVGIQVLHHTFNHPEYLQRNTLSFVSHLAAIDLLFNCGPNSLDLIRLGSRKKSEL
jgi:WbqC-like protein family